MKYAIIVDGIVTGVAVSESALESNWMLTDGTVNVGDLWDGEAFSAPPVDLAALFSAKMERINAGKNAALDGGFVYDGTLYDSDAKARLAYLELATKLASDPTYTTGWKASSGVWVTMTASLFSALRTAYESHIAGCFSWQAAREQELAAAYASQDQDEMEAVDEDM